MLSRFLVVVACAAWARASHASSHDDDDANVEVVAMKRNIADDDSTTTSAQPTTLREADEGVVDGECHNLGLHGSYQQAKAVVSANLTALPMNGTAYAVFKFHVLHVIKESKTEPMLSGEWLTNRTIEVLLLNSMTPCAKTWHARQPFPELLAEYILFLRTPPGQPGDYTISPRDESSVYRSAAGKVSPLWDECRYEELLTDSFGMCNTCVDTTGVLIEEGTPLVTDDGCLVCECHDRVITCHPKFCDLHTVAIVAGGVVVLALVVVGVTCLYRRYRRRQLANLRARRTVIAHRNTINDDDNANAVPLDPDDNNVVLEEMPRAGLISRK